MGRVVPAHAARSSEPLKNQPPKAPLNYARLIPFRCSNQDCRAVLGQTDERWLVIGEVAFDQTQTITHLACGCKTVWRPLR